MNGLESFTCDTGEHHWGGYADDPGAGECHECEMKGKARHEYAGKAKVGLVPVLADKLDKVAATHPDQKVRAAAKRDAEGYHTALAAKADEKAAECPLCGFQFSRPQARCSNKAACEKRQQARATTTDQAPLDRLMADIAEVSQAPVTTSPTRRHVGARWELDLDSLADRMNHDQELRTALVFRTDDPAVAKRVAAFRTRVAKLEAYGDTDVQRMEAVLRRAIELASGDLGEGPWEVSWTHRGYRTEKRLDTFPCRKDALEFVLATPEVRRNGYSLRKAS